MTNNDIVMNYNSLMEIQDEVKTALPIAVSFAIVRNIHIFAPIVQDIEQSRLDIVKRYGGVQKDDSDVYSLPPENVDEINKELYALGMTEVEVPMAKIALDSLQGYDLPILTVNKLYFMITNGEDE